MSNSQPVVKLSNAKKGYPLGKTRVEALRGLSLEVQKGEFAVLTGTSGSGKSTLMNILGCIDHLDSGSFLFEGQETSSLNEEKLCEIRNARIGFIFQSFNLIPVLTVRENVELPLLINANIPASEREQRILQSLEDVGIADKKNNRPDQLSGGQRQRVAIARALASAPALILADEPTANLDSDTSDKILDLLWELNKKRGVTVLISSHDDRVIQRASRLLKIRDGVLV